MLYPSSIPESILLHVLFLARITDHISSCDLPDDVFSEGEVKPTRPLNKKKRNVSDVCVEANPWFGIWPKVQEREIAFDQAILCY